MHSLPFFKLLRLSLGVLVFSAAPVFGADPAPTASAVVALDGSGQFKSIQEALNAAPQLTSAKDLWTIRVKPGVYHELIYIMREKRFVRLVGDDPTTTIITGNLYAGMIGKDNQPLGTFRTPTVWIDADDFGVENLTIQNDAGNVGQALALRVDGDRVTFRHCRFLGWQDTILSNRGRHFFDACTITGAVDFIFGGGNAFFQNCDIVCEGDGYITAPSTLPYDPYGFVFKGCRIKGSTTTVRTYLGRPWRAYAAALFLDTEMSEVVRPAGWHNWDRTAREETSRFIEINSHGPGASPTTRAPWAKSPSKETIQTITPEGVLGGKDQWVPEEDGGGTGGNRGNGVEQKERS